MMHLSKPTFVLAAVLALPAAAAAGPVEFRITPRGFWAQPDQPMLDAALLPTFDAGTHSVDPAVWRAAEVGPLTDFDQSRLPLPGPGDLGSSGTGFWNNAGNFRLDFTLTDVASGQSMDLSMWGRAHAGAFFDGDEWVYGGVTYWFGDGPQYHTIGDQDYVLWGQQRFTGERPVMSVWVGDDPPFPWVPEPGTFALAALGLAPVGLRAWRGRVKIGGAAATPA